MNCELRIHVHVCMMRALMQSSAARWHATKHRANRTVSEANPCSSEWTAPPPPMPGLDVGLRATAADNSEIGMIEAKKFPVYPSCSTSLVFLHGPIVARPPDACGNSAPETFNVDSKAINSENARTGINGLNVRCSCRHVVRF